MQRNEKVALLLVFFVFIASIEMIVVVAQEQDFSQDIVILFDVAHTPVITNYTKAFDYLNQSLNGHVRLYYVNRSLDYTTLSGAHLFVVPAFNKTYSDTEAKILSEYLERGGKILLLGMDYKKGRKFNPDVVIMNSLLADLDLNITVRFNVTGGFGLTVLDPLFNNSFVRLTSEYYTEEFTKEFFNDSFELIVETNIITVEGEDITKLSAILLPPHTYALAGDGTILYFESGAGTLICARKGNGRIAIIGFGLSFSDLLVGGYNKSWIDMGDNKEFWLKFIKKFLGIEEAGMNVMVASEFILAVYSLLILGVVLVILGAVLVLRAPKKEIKKRKKEVKLSEILKKFRSEEGKG